MKRTLLLLSAPLLSGTAGAAELTVNVRTTAGAPVRDAVVMLHPAGAAPMKPQTEASLSVRQQDIQFHPFVLIAPVGAQVAFPNRDKVRHHVYSFSKAKRFELKLFGREESRSVIFDKPGAVALGCNIHDAMTAYVRVVDTPFAVKTDATGAARLPNLPGGAATLRVWHPHLRAPGNELARAVALGGNKAETIAVELRPAG
jgi:plastocyanin